MNRLMGAVACVVVLVGCLRAQERVRMLPSPESDPQFMTRCKHAEVCLSDAKYVCPDGYRKVSFEDRNRERELVFECNGKANW